MGCKRSYKLYPLELCERMIAYYKKYNYDFVLITHRNKKTLIKDSSVKTYTDIPVGKVNKSIRDFHKIISVCVMHFVNKAIKGDGIVEIKKQFQQVRKKNYDTFDAIPIGGSFYNYDFENSYWQMMKQIGIISENVYKKYYSQDSFKLQKAMSMGLTTSCKRAYYYKAGVPFMINGEHFFVDEVRLQERTLFSNVRILSCNYIAAVRKLINDDYVSYTIDSIMCSPKHKDVVQNYFDSTGLDYKVEICRKIDENTYTKKGNLHQFRPVKKMIN